MKYWALCFLFSTCIVINVPALDAAPTHKQGKYDAKNVQIGETEAAQNQWLTKPREYPINKYIFYTPPYYSHSLKNHHNSKYRTNYALVNSLAKLLLQQRDKEATVQRPLLHATDEVLNEQDGLEKFLSSEQQFNSQQLLNYYDTLRRYENSGVKQDRDDNVMSAAIESLPEEAQAQFLGTLLSTLALGAIPHVVDHFTG